MSVVAQDPEQLAKQIEALRMGALFDDGAVVLTPHAEAHFLLALAALEQAKQHMTLAHYHAMKGE